MTPPLDPLNRPLLLLGAGGHARVVLDALRSVGEREVVGILDIDPSRRGGVIDGVPILGGEDSLLEFPPADYELVIGVVGFGRNRPRHALARRLRAAGYVLATIVHASAIVSPRASVAAGVQVLAGAIVNPGAMLLQDVIVNSGAVVEHDCLVASGVHLAPRVILGGGCVIGEEAQLGLGAVLLPGVRIGAGAIVGAGAVVVEDVAPEAMVIGVPARTRTGVHAPKEPAGTA